ncbi:MAG: hypothetical protein U5K28_05565 [Halobacteriales archaeon]|nr:hypothetical protein [Halobacteriales archaeon]
MNKLASAGDGCWQLARHAHIVIYEADDGGELLTIYDCGASQAPPRAQLVGQLVRVDADHERTPQPTGAIVSMREPAELVRESDSHYVVQA